MLAELEMQAACLLFRLGGISSCWLLPSLTDEHVLFLVDVMNLACSLQVRRRLRLPCFYGRPSPVLYRLSVPARHAKKWLKSTWQPKVWLPPGLPLISVKSQQFLTQHYAMPFPIMGIKSLGLLWTERRHGSTKEYQAMPSLRDVAQDGCLSYIYYTV